MQPLRVSTGATTLVAMTSNAPPDMDLWSLPVQAASRSASPAVGSRSPRDPYADNSTRIRDPRFRSFWPRLTILRHDQGLAASPPVRYRLKMEGSGQFPFPLIARCGRTTSVAAPHVTPWCGCAAALRPVDRQPARSESGPLSLPDQVPYDLAVFAGQHDQAGLVVHQGAVVRGPLPVRPVGLTQTSLGPGGYWGLTQITAYDEVLLLRLLLTKNPVLDTTSRDYALRLMAQVISSQRWGVPAGAPARLTVHVKNGWLPLPAHGWRIHSIGCFTGRGGGYSIVVLTQDNPAMAYGIATIEAIAAAINHDLNPRTASVIRSSEVSSSWETPDEPVPAPPSHS